ncbi:hypothetical protein JR316_0013413 [Psilocybe cubensis]|uniref:Uncharacterized protein n=1 Tax=Psilocybe cubensis TaxID=181762 RepID=A0ACB8GEZ6_PSICU|nr:uncharacterized protein JR316_0013413 [Psilocybe cubensis]KAH9474250.1 hypothetical protein JR316_0013413 [Psilocybe cubensis]
MHFNSLVAFTVAAAAIFAGAVPAPTNNGGIMSLEEMKACYVFASYVIDGDGVARQAGLRETRRMRQKWLSQCTGLLTRTVKVANNPDANVRSSLSTGTSE